MGLIAIPKQLLVDTVKHKVTSTQDKMGKKSFSSEQTFRNVRFTVRNAYGSKSSGDINNATVAKLYYDVVNSTGMIIVPKKGDIIQANGQDYTVNIVEIAREFGDKIHHYRLVMA